MRSHDFALSLSLGVLVAAQGAQLSAQNHVYTMNGDGYFDELGSSVRSAGDVDNDGYPDIIAGAIQVAAGGTGYARVFAGIDGRQLFTVNGSGGGDAFGFAVSGAGDVDKDGHADFIVGAPQEFC